MPPTLGDRPRRLLAAVAVTLAVAACGGAPAADPGDELPAWVPLPPGATVWLLTVTHAESGVEGAFEATAPGDGATAWAFYRERLAADGFSLELRPFALGAGDARSLRAVSPDGRRHLAITIRGAPEGVALRADYSEQRPPAV